MKIHGINWPGCKKTICGKKSTKGYSAYRNIYSITCGNCRYILGFDRGPSTAVEDTQKISNPPELEVTTTISAGPQFLEDLTDKLEVLAQRLDIVSLFLMESTEVLLTVKKDLSTGNFQ